MKKYFVPLSILLVLILTSGSCIAQKVESTKTVAIGLMQSRNNQNLIQVFPFLKVEDDFVVKRLSNQLGLSFTNFSERRYTSFTYASWIYMNNYSRFVQNLVDGNGPNTKLLLFDFHVRLEKGYLFKAHILPSMRYGIAFSLDPRYVYRNSDNTLLTSFPISLHSAEIASNIIPVLIIDLTRKLYFTMKTPFEIFSAGILRGNNKSPSLIFEDRKLKHEYLSLGSLQPTVNLSLAYKI